MNHVSYHLLIDIGNTTIHIGLCDNGRILQEWRLNTQKKYSKDNIKKLSFLKNIPSKNIQAIGLASVVPHITSYWKKILEDQFSRPVYTINAKDCLPFFTIKYDNILEIGSDRLCNVLACQYFNITESVIIDFGTATTFDVYHSQTYWGGIICLGVLSSLDTLYQQASMIEKVDLHWNTQVTGQNTADAIRNGTLFGTIGQIEYLLKKIKQQHHLKNPQIILTGGLSSIIKERLKEGLVQSNFTLLGIHHFLKLKRKATF